MLKQELQALYAAALATFHFVICHIDTVKLEPRKTRSDLQLFLTTGGWSRKLEYIYAVNVLIFMPTV